MIVKKKTATNLSMIPLRSVLARMEGTAARDIPWECRRRGSCQSIAWSDTQALKEKKKSIDSSINQYYSRFNKNWDLSINQIHLVIQRSRLTT